MSDDEKSDPVFDPIVQEQYGEVLVPESEGFGPEDVVDDPEFDETAFIDDDLVVEDEPMAVDNVVHDPNPTQIQDDEVSE